MKKISMTCFEDGDLELLQNATPDPCRGCLSQTVCCGCGQAREWEEKYGKELKARNLMQLAKYWWDYKDSAAAVQAAKKLEEACKQRCMTAGLSELFEGEGK